MTEQAISESTRDRAINLVQRAYGEGHIDEPDLERRLDLILTAATYPQVRLAIADLPTPTPSRLPTQVAARSTPPSQGDVMAPLVHLSGLVTGPIGPGMAWLVTRDRTHAGRESAKALNFQLASVFGFAAAMLLTMLGLRFLGEIWLLTWLILTITGAVKAYQGVEWENPLTQVTGFRPISVPHS